MSFAFMPLYTGDYQRDTRHLSPMKHGIYLCLLMHCWDQKGPCPLDEQECSGIANCRSSDEMEALQYVLAKFFVRMNDGFYNSRMQLEIEKAHALSLARSGAGRKGYEAKARQLLNKSQASARQVPLHPPPHLHPQLEKEKTPLATPSALPDWFPADRMEAFRKHRKAMKKELTAEGERLLLLKLSKLRREGHDPIDLVNDAIANGWQGIVVPKTKPQRSPADVAAEAIRMMEDR